ncbi:hypothetical protein [Ligilactobacillus salivarius]|jgi:hypothetical protein|uniref:hypothetical protein n=1 Tax=Ligilactobacillus salivarius TaxID=1624 RepID=UPI00136B9530|nr:hypothetical protein [Ligilactobacillus salivarius]MYU86479.1 hypothetical protein [Ligilactobacillus salivarius]MYU88475.1 hypothetical protein [Ligilactobacillus salivarius]MYV15501.1 hypothetical protein [Ligilactobacillus salivarius]
MEIEYKNQELVKNIYQVGNVISRFNITFLVAKTRYVEEKGYCFVNLINGEIITPICRSLEVLYKNYGVDQDRLVKAKLTIDYKLNGDTEDEDAE